ncbi:MAG TPA: diacylglycerol kinase family protein [Gemmatimonadales bacterium]|nr:diacylglycerol kinase family protein [Gemmatimonadales bacterium]
MAIPAFVNPRAGSARVALDALRRVGGFEERLVPPPRLFEAIRQAAGGGAERVLVAGGDGTLATAAAALAGSSTAMAILPGGTLNHFARDYGIPTEPDDALRVAATGVVGTVDLGYVHRQPFINTSSLGAYVHFVHLRDRLEPAFGYRLASVFAGLRTLASLRRLPFVINTAGALHLSEAPLLFVGVGERVLTPVGRGARKPGGARTLEVVIPHGRRQTRRFTRAYARGGRLREAPPLPGEFGLDTMLLDRFRVELPGRAVASVAVDGEIRRMRTPLDYRIERDALRVVGVSDRAVDRGAASSG